MKKRSTFLEQIRTAQQAAKTKPETGVPKPTNCLKGSKSAT